MRKEYVKLVDSVRESGGEVKIFSSMHISGERKYYPVLATFSKIFNVQYKKINTLREKHNTTMMCLV